MQSQIKNRELPIQLHYTIMSCKVFVKTIFDYSVLYLNIKIIFHYSSELFCCELCALIYETSRKTIYHCIIYYPSSTRSVVLHCNMRIHFIFTWFGQFFFGYPRKLLVIKLFSVFLKLSTDEMNKNMNDDEKLLSKKE